MTTSAPLLGVTLDGEFELIERIGEGGFGTVYKAIQHPLGRAVAIKVLKAEGRIQNPVVQARFFREARSIAQLRSPHTVTLLKYSRTMVPVGGITRPVVYMALEYIQGRSLRAFLEEEGPMPPILVKSLALQMLDALQEAHGMGIVHRDLKPENVLVETAVDGSSRAKVLDFGIAKALEDDEGDLSSRDLTQEGTLLGTLAYMAPEQFTRDKVGPYTDVYSMGMVIYTLLTGAPPFQGSTYSVMCAHTQNPPPPIPEGLEGLPLGRVMHRAMAKDPTQRFADAGAMREALLAMGAGVGFGETMEAPLPLTPPVGLLGDETLPGAPRLDDTPLPMTDALGPVIAETPGPEVEPDLAPAPEPEPERTLTPGPQSLTLERPMEAPTPASANDALSDPNFVGATTPAPAPQAARRGPPPPPARKAPAPRPPSVSKLVLISLVVAGAATAAALYATGVIGPEPEPEPPPPPPPKLGGSVNLGGVRIGCPKGMVAITPKEAGEIFCIDTHERPGVGKMPEVGVSFAAAMRACSSEGRRLCSGKEWRRACGAEMAFPYGEDFEEDRCATAGEVEVAGSRKRCAGRFGAFDMSGNVAEWTSDRKLRGGDVGSIEAGAGCEAEAAAEAAAELKVGFRCCARHKR